MTLEYAAGLLENLGGFYVFNNKKRKAVHPKFKIVCSGQEKANLITDLVIYLKKNHGIEFTIYAEKDNFVFSATRFEVLENLVNFLDKYCEIKKTNQDWVKDIIEKRKKLLAELQKKKKTVYEKNLVNGNGNEN